MFNPNQLAGISPNALAAPMARPGTATPTLAPAGMPFLGGPAPLPAPAPQMNPMLRTVAPTPTPAPSMPLMMPKLQPAPQQPGPFPSQPAARVPTLTPPWRRSAY